MFLGMLVSLSYPSMAQVMNPNAEHDALSHEALTS